MEMHAKEVNIQKQWLPVVPTCLSGFHVESKAQVQNKKKKKEKKNIPAAVLGVC